MLNVAKQAPYYFKPKTIMCCKKKINVVLHNSNHLTAQNLQSIFPEWNDEKIQLIMSIVLQEGKCKILETKSEDDVYLLTKKLAECKLSASVTL